MTIDYPWPVRNHWPYNSWQYDEYVSERQLMDMLDTWLKPSEFKGILKDADPNIFEPKEMIIKSKSEIIDEIVTSCYKYCTKKNILFIERAKDLLASLSNDGLPYNEWLILHLMINNAECWVAQDVVTGEVNNDIIAMAAKTAQSTNKERAKTMGEIDGDSLRGQKSY